MRFTQIRYANRVVELEYEEKSDTRTRKIAETYEEEPTPEFQHAMQALRPHLPGLTAIKDKNFWEKAEVLAAHISYSREDERRGVKVSIKRPVDNTNSPVTLSTPLVHESDKVDLPVFGALDELIARAQGYLAGERAQLSFANGNGNGNGNGKKKRSRGEQVELEHEMAEEKREADRLIEQQRLEAEERMLQHTRSAVVCVLPDMPDGIESTTQISDDELLQLIGHAWEGVELEHEGRKYDGLVSYEAPDGQVLWFFVRGGDEPAFFGPVPAPDQFDITSSIPRFYGAGLLAFARTAYFPAECPASEPEPVTSDDVAAAIAAHDTPSTDPFGYRAETYPAVDGKNDIAGALRRGLHQILFLEDGRPESEQLPAAKALLALYENACEHGVSTEQLAEVVQGAFYAAAKGRDGWTFSVTLDTEAETASFVEVHAATQPPMLRAGTTKKTRVTIEGTELIAAARLMLRLPQVNEARDLDSSCEAPEPVAAAAANTGTDLFGEDD